jgi:hypothetical protein
MQPPQEESSKHHFVFQDYIQLFRVMARHAKHPETLEPYLATLKDKGLSDEQIAALGGIVVARLRASQDTETSYRLDSYLLTGMGAIDIVLLPVLLPMGIPDTSLFAALLALSISLVLVASSLVVGFVKKDLGVKGYGRTHGTLIFLALGSGIVALAATLWHISQVIAAVFTVLAIVAYVLCALYAAFARLGLAFWQVVKAANTEVSGQTSQPVDTTGSEVEPATLRTWQ